MLRFGAADLQNFARAKTGQSERERFKIVEHANVLEAEIAAKRADREGPARVREGDRIARDGCGHGNESIVRFGINLRKIGSYRRFRPVMRRARKLHDVRERKTRALGDGKARVR